MAEEFEDLFTDFTSEGVASEQDLSAVEHHYDCQLPLDYYSFMLHRDGGEGFVGEQYLILWKAAELISFNREYEVEKYAPGLMFFGSNGGGEAFGLDLRKESKPIVMVPFIGMDLEYVIELAPTFREFLERLSDGLN